MQLAKRALVVLLRALASTYGLQLELTRDSPDEAVTKAFRRVAVKVHPDKGGSKEDSQRLLEARANWAQAVASKFAANFKSVCKAVIKAKGSRTRQ